MKLKKLLTAVLALVMVFSNALVASAVNGPSERLGYICIYSLDDESTEVFLLDNYINRPIGTIDGATYNKSTNTLSLDNFNQPALCIATNTMGDDFKIELKGKNNIQALNVWGDGHGGSCEFTGTGELFVNENKRVKNAISLFPEGTNAILKASQGTIINAYAPEGGNAVFVNATENKNCISGNSSSAPKVENYSNNKGIPVITDIYGEDDNYDSFNFYTKEGASNPFAVKIDEYLDGSKYYNIYQVVKNPEDDSYILCYYYRNAGDFVPSDYGFTATDKISNVRKTSYSTYETLWNDSNGNRYVFLYEWSSETGSYYQKYSVAEFIKSDSYYGGEMNWYKTIPTDDTTKYEDNRTAPEKAGYTVEKEVIDGLYNLYVTDSPYTLKATDASTSIDIRIGSKVFKNITGDQTIIVDSLDLSDITVLTQNGVDVEGASDKWSMSTNFLDSQNRGVLEVQQASKTSDSVTFNLVSHYEDCPGADFEDFQIMLITAHMHKYTNKVTKATLSKNGKIVPTCSCGATKNATAINYPKTIKLSATSYTYDGKVKKPTVIVKDSKGKTIASNSYTVSYASGRKNVGKYAVKLVFKGNYSGTKTLHFTINPKGTSISKLTAGSKKFTAKWNKQSTQTTGYQIQYSTSSKFTGTKTVTITKNSTLSKTISKLKGKKKYYVKVRTYKTVSGTKYYSSWSGAKIVTTKK